MYAVGVGAPSWVYAVLGGLGVACLVAIPVLLVAERGVGGRWAALATLAGACVAGLVLGGVSAAPSESGGGAPRYAAGLSRIFGDLNETQARVLGDGLAGNRTEQAAQAGSLADAFALAAVRVKDLRVAGVDASLNRQIAARLEAPAVAYEELRAAALDPDGSQEKLNARLADVRAATESLEAVDGILRREGYQLSSVSPRGQ